MSNYTTLLDCEAIHSAFRAGTAAQESLDAELRESLAALEAYQSHLDGWQQQLAEERDELRQAQEQFECNRAAALQSGDAATELQQARVDEEGLKSALEEQKRILDQERAQWAEESRRLHDLLEERGEAVASAAQDPTPAQTPAAEPSPTSAVKNPAHSSGGAVLGSIVEQFGKLRQQRAIDRQSVKKTR